MAKSSTSFKAGFFEGQTITFMCSTTHAVFRGKVLSEMRSCGKLAGLRIIDLEQSVVGHRYWERHPQGECDLAVIVGSVRRLDKLTHFQTSFGPANAWWNK